MASSRFLRTEMLLGSDAVARLAQARVLVAGLGAVGSFATEALARSGVGELVLVDFDTLSTSNVNRQLFALESTRGRMKVQVARERVLDINPACRVDARQVFIHGSTIQGLLTPRPHLVVDAIDSLNPKLNLLQQVVEAGIPVVSCLGAARRTEPTAFRVADIAETRVCKLARLVRKKLRQRGVTTGIRCIYSEEPNAPLDDRWAHTEERTREGGRARIPMGSLCSVVGVAGLLTAHEALRLLLGGFSAVGAESTPSRSPSG